MGTDPCMFAERPAKGGVTDIQPSCDVLKRQLARLLRPHQRSRLLDEVTFAMSLHGKRLNRRTDEREENRGSRGHQLLQAGSSFLGALKNLMKAVEHALLLTA